MTNTDTENATTRQQATGGQHATRRSWADRLFCYWYPSLMGLAERAGQAEVRQAQLAAATGRTLEIGAGDGLSVAHYPDALAELVLVEPDPGFRRRLEGAMAGVDRPWPWTVLDGDVHRLPFAAGSFDTVTASFTFCSVASPALGLREVHRVLRPDGRFLFHEHVRARGVRGRAQDVLAPVQVALAGGCHPNRDFLALLEASPLTVAHVVASEMPRAFPSVKSVVHGTANR